jgi:hypothetical protein
MILKLKKCKFTEKEVEFLRYIKKNSLKSSKVS